MSKLHAMSTAALLAWVAAAPVQAAGLAKDTYDAGKQRIEQRFKTERAACASLAGNGKDVCVLQAQERLDVARAELEYAYTQKPEDRARLASTRADAAHAVARERCDDLAGNARDLCVTQAKAEHTKALADARSEQKIEAARQEAAQDKRDAEYTVALQRCDALAGDAKAACIAQAKARFGKSG